MWNLYSLALMIHLTISSSLSGSGLQTKHKCMERSLFSNFHSMAWRFRLVWITWYRKLGLRAGELDSLRHRLSSPAPSVSTKKLLHCSFPMVAGLSAQRAYYNNTFWLQSFPDQMWTEPSCLCVCQITTLCDNTALVHRGCRSFFPRGIDFRSFQTNGKSE